MKYDAGLDERDEARASACVAYMGVVVVIGGVGAPAKFRDLDGDRMRRTTISSWREKAKLSRISFESQRK